VVSPTCDIVKPDDISSSISNGENLCGVQAWKSTIPPPDTHLVLSGQDAHPDGAHPYGN